MQQKLSGKTNGTTFVEQKENGIRKIRSGMSVLVATRGRCWIVASQNNLLPGQTWIPWNPLAAARASSRANALQTTIYWRNGQSSHQQQNKTKRDFSPLSLALLKSPRIHHVGTSGPVIMSYIKIFPFSLDKVMATHPQANSFLPWTWIIIKCLMAVFVKIIFSTFIKKNRTQDPQKLFQAYIYIYK